MKPKQQETGRDLSGSQDEMELSALMRRAQQGDAQSYKTLLMRINLLMTDFVHNSFTRFGLAQESEQEEVVQEILLGIHSKRNTYDPAQYFLPWLYAIARYKVVDYVRRSGVKQKVTDPLDAEVETLEAVASYSPGAGIDVLQLCESLPAKQRELIKLVKLDGLSVAEVSAKTGYSPSDIKVSVHRALRALQNKIKESGYEK
jgi:RNA polymerase sigma-70 factor (ECF subfamily)